MGKEVWGTFSVKDHCDLNSFIAEVMLYDRLVIPVPPDEKERARWEKEGWQPERLDEVLNILGSRAHQVKWDDQRQAAWKTRYDAAKGVAGQTDDLAFRYTKTELIKDLPGNVTGVQAVTNYVSKEELKKELGLTEVPDGAVPPPLGVAVAILGHEFLVPNDPKWKPEYLLQEAVALSSEPAFRRKRASFWRWQREFLQNRVTAQEAIDDAVEEMKELLEEEKSVVLKKDIKTGVQFAFLVGSASIGFLGGPLTAAGVAGAFVSVGGFAADKLLQDQNNDNDKPVSLLRDIKKHFGWEKLANG